jgi:hypothetical protein
VCPVRRLVPGARGDTRGDRRGPAPVWTRTVMPPLPSPLPLAVGPVLREATRARRQRPHPRSQAALPPQRAAVTLHAVGIDVGAEAHDVAVPPRAEPPGRGVGADPGA